MWPPDVQQALHAYLEARRRYDDDQECGGQTVSFTEVEVALVVLGEACVAWAARAGRIAPRQQRYLAAVGGRRA